MPDAITVLRAHPRSVGKSPTWAAQEGRVYWVDIIDKRLHSLEGSALPAPANTSAVTDPDDRLVPTTAVTPDPGRSWQAEGLICGVVPRARGGLVIGLRRSLMTFNTETQETSTVVDLEPERPENRLNEMKCDPFGRLWIGTMQNNVASDGTEQPIAEDAGAPYLLDNDASVHRVLDGIGISNT